MRSAASFLKRPEVEGEALCNIGNAHLDLGETKEAIKFYNLACAKESSCSKKAEWLCNLGYALRLVKVTHQPQTLWIRH